jgi:hypothetical protein
MILLGIAATSTGAIDGWVLERNCIDVSSNEPIPLYHRHERPIGQVLCLQIPPVVA